MSRFVFSGWFFCLTVFGIVYALPVIAKQPSPPIVRAPASPSIALLRQHRGTAYLPSAKRKLNQFFYLARDRHENVECASKVSLVEYNAHSNEELISAYNTIGKDPNVVAVIGVSTSKEALLVEPLSKKHQLLTVSVAGSHDDIGKKSPYMVSGSNSVSSYVEYIVKHIAANGFKHVLVVYNPLESYTANYAHMLKQRMPSGVDTDEFQLHKATTLGDFAVQDKSYDLVIVSNFTYLGVHFLNQYLHHERYRTTPVIVTPAWHFNESFVGEHVVDKRLNIFTHTTWYIPEDVSKVSSKAKQVFAQEGGEIESQHVQEYDLMTMLLDSVCSVKKGSRKLVYDAFKQVKTYHGLLGHYIYESNAAHARKPVHFMKFSFPENRFKLVDER